VLFRTDDRSVHGFSTPVTKIFGAAQSRSIITAARKLPTSAATRTYIGSSMVARPVSIDCVYVCIGYSHESRAGYRKWPIRQTRTKSHVKDHGNLANRLTLDVSRSKHPKRRICGLHRGWNTGGSGPSPFREHSALCGTLSHCAIYALSPRSGHSISKSARDKLDELRVTTLM